MCFEGSLPYQCLSCNSHTIRTHYTIIVLRMCVYYPNVPTFFEHMYRPLLASVTIKKTLIIIISIVLILCANYQTLTAFPGRLLVGV